MPEQPKFTEQRNVLDFIEASPKPSEEELQAHYRSKYYQVPEGSYHTAYTEQELQYFHNIARVAHRMAQKHKLAESLLDVGCGEGFFVNAFETFGWDLACCDYSSFGISKHNPHLLPYFQQGNIEQAMQHYQGRTFGLINLQNVLEHVLDPFQTMAQLKPYLAANSMLRIKVPNDYSDFQLALQQHGYTDNTWFVPPEHLSYFNQDNLVRFIAACGYRLVSLQSTFPIEIFLTNTHSNYWQDRSLGKQAHFSRVFCENFLIDKHTDNYIRYAEASAALGFGRELIAYVAPE